jgi:hypothetical protein
MQWAQQQYQHDDDSALCSFVNSLSSSGAPLMPRAALQSGTHKVVYVTYCRTASLPAMINLLRAYFGQLAGIGVDTYIWLDIFATDQSATATVASVLPDVTAALQVCSAKHAAHRHHKRALARLAASRGKGELHILSNQSAILILHPTSSPDKSTRFWGELVKFAALLQEAKAQTCCRLELCISGYLSVFRWISPQQVLKTSHFLGELAKSAALVQATHRMIVVLDENAELFSRAWCLFELFTAAMSAQAPADRWLHILANAFCGTEVQLIDAVFSANLDTAKCSNEADMSELVEAVRLARGSAGQGHVGTFVADTVWRSLEEPLTRVTSPSRGDVSIDNVKACFLPFPAAHFTLRLTP